MSRRKGESASQTIGNDEGNVSPSELAILYTALDEREKAFASLERAYAEHDYQLQFLGLPEFDSLRSDPRFGELMRRIGLTP